AFTLEASAGCPPDPCFTKGQDWGFAPLHPQHIREDGYRYVQEYLRFQMRHTGLLRIDHVMGLHRLYWVPKGLSAAEGAYVTYHADELYAILCLESVRHQTTLVGENLGTVPPEVNSRMDRHELRQMFVVQYEQRPDLKAPLRIPPEHCVASMNTHDMPTFAAHWQGKDITDRAELGLIPKGQLKQERQTRRESNLALAEMLRREGWLAGERPTMAAVLRAMLHWLADSPAELLLINLEDLILEELPQNVPGTSQERPNWRRKASFTVEELRENAAFAEVLEEVEMIRSEAKPEQPPKRRRK
ncbi:MAG TPA: 4-alpha-glucanotransferase, partial [Prosthecobacter sp.]|nr:4-alpha-glucanotransferase [Prosthecobacter sp.]